MADVTPGRLAALDILARTARGQRLDRALDRVATDLDSRERALAYDLSYGATRLRGRLDHLLAPHVQGGLARLDPPVLATLRLGLYQLLYQSVPAYAAVSQAVELARAAGAGRASGLVNAVLRRAGEAGDDSERFPEPEADPAGFLSTWGSHPRWLIERWLARWPVAEVRRLVELNNTIPELHLVPLDGDLEGAATALQGAGGEVDALRLPGSLRVRGLDPVRALSRVPGFIQDPAASLVCRYAAPPPDALVADLCAAPGGKALYLARGARYVLAADPSGPRLKPVRDNVRRTGLPVGVVQARAEAAPLATSGAGAVDLVLVDVPCSGTGTLRRHPDARWRLKPEAPEELAVVQLRILEGAARVVPPGALLVYSTCTLEPEENAGVVEAFLARHPDFRVEPPRTHEMEPEEERGPAEEVGPAEEGLPGRALPMSADGYLQVLPQDSGWDGAFAVRLRRVG